MLSESLFTENPNEQGRINLFNNQYHLMGIDEWEDLNSLSYAKTYAFGKFLYDSFGEKNFIREVCLAGNKENLSNMNAIISSIEKNTGKHFNQDQIFKLFIKDCVSKIDFRSGPSAFLNSYKSELHAHGFMIHYAGIAEEDSVTLIFDKSTNPDEEILIFTGD